MRRVAVHAERHARAWADVPLRSDLSGADVAAIVLEPIGLGGAMLGVLVFAGFVLFTMVTLPVEIDASQRAQRALAPSTTGPPSLYGLRHRREAHARSYRRRAARADRARVPNPARTTAASA